MLFVAKKETALTEGCKIIRYFGGSPFSLVRSTNLKRRVTFINDVKMHILVFFKDANLVRRLAIHCSIPELQKR